MDSEALELLRRNSGLGLDAEGVFFLQGERVPNERVQALFHRNLAVRETGDVTLTLGKVWAYVNTETVARFVTAVKRKAGLLEISFLNGDYCEVNCPRVSMGPDNRFYLWETDESYPAVLLRNAHNMLGHMLEDSQNEVGFVLGNEWIRVGRLDRNPGPAGR